MKHRFTGAFLSASSAFGLAACESDNNSSRVDSAITTTSLVNIAATTEVLVPTDTVAPLTLPPTTLPVSETSTATTAAFAATLLGCVLRINVGDTLSEIAAGDPDGVTVNQLVAENVIPDPDDIEAGTYLDRCIGNGINDVTGGPWAPMVTFPPTTAQETTTTTIPETTTTIPETTTAVAATGVKAQQERLNELLTPYGFDPLTVDGISGDYTRRALCTARWLLGLPYSFTDMEPGSNEEKWLMQAGLVLPSDIPNTERWGAINIPCQSQIYGTPGNLTYVWPTSTGSAGYETRAGVFPVRRYDSGSDNIEHPGWHNSSVYPVRIDNPLNGNMYKPLYFDQGQAVHGANEVPPFPASKGCARLSVQHQEQLITWLGLQDVKGVTEKKSRINLTLSVFGKWVVQEAA